MHFFWSLGFSVFWSERCLWAGDLRVAQLGMERHACTKCAVRRSSALLLTLKQSLCFIIACYFLIGTCAVCCWCLLWRGLVTEAIKVVCRSGCIFTLSFSHTQSNHGHTNHIGFVSINGRGRDPPPLLNLHFAAEGFASGGIDDQAGSFAIRDRSSQFPRLWDLFDKWSHHSTLDLGRSMLHPLENK